MVIGARLAHAFHRHRSRETLHPLYVGNAPLDPHVLGKGQGALCYIEGGGGGGGGGDGGGGGGRLFTYCYGICSLADVIVVAVFVVLVNVDEYFLPFIFV